MPLVLLIVLGSWLLIAAFAVLLCAAARRTDDEIAGTDLAPVIDIKSSLARQNVA